MNYSPELKEAMLRRMLPPNNESITKISNVKDVPDERRLFHIEGSFIHLSHTACCSADKICKKQFIHSRNHVCNVTVDVCPV